MGGTGYLIVRYVKMEETEEMKIGKKVISKKQLKQILTVEMGVAVLLLVIVVGVVVRDRRAAPEDSSAATGTTVICNGVPGGETRVRFNVKAVSGNGSVTNKATVVSGGETSTCEHTIMIEGVSETQVPGTTTPPSSTPTGTTVPGGTNTPIPSQTPVAPTNTTVPTTPGATGLPQPTPTIQPTPGVGIACGKADVNNDGKFTLVDFRDFAKIYQRECNDGHLDYGECGHKDSDRNGKIEIRDFQSFAGRYAPRESCALP